MKAHFCRIGRRTVSPLLGKNIEDMEKSHSSIVEEAYSTMHTDASLSDLLFHEAFKLKKRILSLKNQITPSSNFDAAF